LRQRQQQQQLEQLEQQRLNIIRQQEELDHQPVQRNQIMNHPVQRDEQQNRQQQNNQVQVTNRDVRPQPRTPRRHESAEMTNRQHRLLEDPNPNLRLQRWSTENNNGPDANLIRYNQSTQESFNSRIANRSDINSHDQQSPPNSSRVPRENRTSPALRDYYLQAQIAIEKYNREKEKLMLKNTMHNILPRAEPVSARVESSARKVLTYFSGKTSESLKDWLFQVERYFTKVGTPDELKADFAIDYLKENARLVFLSAGNSLNAPWEAYVKALKAQYEPENFQLVLRQQLENLSQDSNDITEHVYKFDSIMNRINDMGEYDKIRHFIKSLNPKTASKVNDLFPRTLSEAKE
jgi:hypothetical protein